MPCTCSVRSWAHHTDSGCYSQHPELRKKRATRGKGNNGRGPGGKRSRDSFGDHRHARDGNTQRGRYGDNNDDDDDSRHDRCDRIRDAAVASAAAHTHPAHQADVDARLDHFHAVCGGTDDLEQRQHTDRSETNTETRTAAAVASHNTGTGNRTMWQLCTHNPSSAPGHPVHSQRPSVSLIDRRLEDTLPGVRMFRPAAGERRLRITLALESPLREVTCWAELYARPAAATDGGQTRGAAQEPRPVCVRLAVVDGMGTDRVIICLHDLRPVGLQASVQNDVTMWTTGPGWRRSRP